MKFVVWKNSNSFQHFFVSLLQITQKNPSENGNCSLPFPVVFIIHTQLHVRITHDQMWRLKKIFSLVQKYTLQIYTSKSAWMASLYFQPITVTCSAPDCNYHIPNPITNIWTGIHFTYFAVHNCRFWTNKDHFLRSDYVVAK